MRKDELARMQKVGSKADVRGLTLCLASSFRLKDETEKVSKKELGWERWRGKQCAL